MGVEKDIENDGHVSLSYKFLKWIKSLVKNNSDSEMNIFTDPRNKVEVLFPYIPDNNF